MSIEFKKIDYTYSVNTPFQFVALKQIDLNIEMNKVTAIIGATGSGKSTLVQHLNGLILPTSGQLIVNDFVINANVKVRNLKSLRKNVGLVFQFPEYQLFEESIIKDIAFGPKNFGVPEDEANKIAKASLKLVGLDESYLEKSPLDLSGGQKRRVAIAGILAMEPDVLVLDEPTAGLDPQGAKQMMELFKKLNTVHNKTVLLVTHDMEHVYNYCDNVVVMKKGEVFLNSSVNTFFENTTYLDELNILAPNIIRLKNMLKNHNIDVSGCDDIHSICDKIVKELK